MDELFEAKLRLYHLLLKKPVEDLTDAEVNEMYELSRDPQVQEFLTVHMGPSLRK